MKSLLTTILLLIVVSMPVFGEPTEVTEDSVNPLKDTLGEESFNMMESDLTIMRDAGYCAAVSDIRSDHVRRDEFRAISEEYMNSASAILAEGDWEKQNYIDEGTPITLALLKEQLKKAMLRSIKNGYNGYDSWSSKDMSERLDVLNKCNELYMEHITSD